MPVSSTPRDADTTVARIAAAIGEPARARILYCLMANRARTATELATVADVTPSTASAHLARLSTESLIKVSIQGKHRYFSLAGENVAHVLESLSILAGGSSTVFVPSTPEYLRAARTCYDHIAGTLGVALHDRLTTLGHIAKDVGGREDSYGLTSKGEKAFVALGVNVEGLRGTRRRFAYACLDWSERRSHLGGALGAALLDVALRKRWVAHEREGRALRVTALGQRELASNFGVRI
jgi:DNA-binding transcriptional ArsR family regulator